MFLSTTTSSNRADADSAKPATGVLAGPNPIPNPQSRAAARKGEPNFIELYWASGQGHLSQGDVRATQQNDRYLQPH